MLADPGKWPYQFGLTYSVTLSSEDLETSLVVRNTGSTNYDFHVLFHTYLAVDVSAQGRASRLGCPMLPSLGKRKKDTGLIMHDLHVGHNRDFRQRARVLPFLGQNQILHHRDLPVGRTAHHRRRNRPDLHRRSGASHHRADQGRPAPVPARARHAAGRRGVEPVGGQGEEHGGFGAGRRLATLPVRRGRQREPMEYARCG